ncbi:hypothetical protein ACKER9_16590 [Acinetobacter baumannii]|uniref:hypothetical protein n=1 Tax=Acinetobacter baumannii TaxID=470 RepID=UPI0038B5A66E
MDWTQKIARLALVKSSLYEADTRKIWPYYLPELAATIDDIIKTEIILVRQFRFSFDLDNYILNRYSLDSDLIKVLIVIWLCCTKI